MYEEYFGLKTKPFHITPNLNFLYLTTTHKEAISCLKFGIMEEDIGIILLTGDVGTGKTTLIRYILDSIKDNIEVATIYNTNVSSEQLLASIMEEFGLDSHFDNKIRAIKTLQSYLQSLRELNRRPLLIVDDAQNLSMEALEEIRLLSNLQNNSHMLVQIILVGQPELDMKLADSKVSSLSQRISISYKLLPFGRKTTEKYIIHRLKIAGYHKSNLFTQAALDLVHSTTRGIPRAINLLCDNAMTYAFGDNVRLIDAPCIKDVLKENRSRALRGGRHHYLSSIKDRKTSFEQSTHLANPVKTHVQDLTQNYQNVMSLSSDSTKRLIPSNLIGLKNLLEKERLRNDQLLIKYTELKNKYNTLRKNQFKKKQPQVKAVETKNKVRPINTTRQVTQLVTPKNRH
jgi:type II secretory pathway predicted ATPase ExeA